MKKVTIGLVACAWLTCSALADNASHRQAVLTLLELTNVQRTIEQVTTSIEGMIQQQIQNMNLPPEGQETAAAVQKESMTWLSEFFAWEKIRDNYVTVYAKAFSEGEINELISFYRSPVGQKVLEKMPEVQQETMKALQAMLQERMPEFQQRITEKMSEIGAKYKQ